MNYAQIAAAVYQRCNHFDPYLPALTADLARAWGALFAKHKLDQADLLAAVEVVYDENGRGYRPMVADIVKAARSIRRERYERSDLNSAERLAHEAICDAKAVEVPPEVAEASRRTIAGFAFRPLQLTEAESRRRLVERQRRAAPPQPIPETGDGEAGNAWPSRSEGGAVDELAVESNDSPPGSR